MRFEALDQSELNRFVKMLEFDRDIKVYYMTQMSLRSSGASR
jgi:hypothetical protein